MLHFFELIDRCKLERSLARKLLFLYSFFDICTTGEVLVYYICAQTLAQLHAYCFLLSIWLFFDFLLNVYLYTSHPSANKGSLFIT